jgi:hypothetical protein
MSDTSSSNEQYNSSPYLDVYKSAESEYNRRKNEEKQSRARSFLGTIVSPITSGFGGAREYLFETQAAPQELLYTDPIARREQIVSQREQAAISAAEQDYNRRMAAFTGGYSPAAERQMQAAQTAWDRALADIAGQQGAVGGYATQSGRDYRTTGTNVNIAAQRAMTGRGTIPATGVAGLGGVTGVPAMDMAAQTGQRANVEAAARQAALQARAGQLGSVQDLILAQMAASQAQLAQRNLDREAAIRAAYNEQRMQAEAAAREQAAASRAAFDVHSATVAEQTPFWRREWKNLGKDEKKRLEREEGVKSESDYLIKKSAEAWALGQMAQG